MALQSMNLEVLLPSRRFLAASSIARIVAETREGSFGLLPRRLDCVAALTPGILTYQILSGDEKFIAVDEGVLVKSGSDVRISVRRALGGTDLSALRDTIEKEFLQRDELEQNLRSVLARLEAGFLRRMAALRND